MKKEPALTVGTITAVATALLALLAVFGLQLDTQQSAAVLGIVAALAPLVSAWFTRRRVTPVQPKRASQRGNVDVALLFIVLTFVGVLLLLLGVHSHALSGGPVPSLRDTNWPCAAC